MISDEKKAIQVADFCLKKYPAKKVKRRTTAREQPINIHNLIKGPSIQDILWHTFSFEDPVMGPI